MRTSCELKNGAVAYQVPASSVSAGILSYMEQERPKVGIGVIVLKEGKVLLGERIASHGRGELAAAGRAPGIRRHLRGYGQAGSRGGDRAYRYRGRGIGVRIQRARLREALREPRLPRTLEERRALRAEPDKARNWSWFDPNELPEHLFAASRACISNWKSGTIYTP